MIERGFYTGQISLTLAMVKQNTPYYKPLNASSPVATSYTYIRKKISKEKNWPSAPFVNDS